MAEKALPDAALPSKPRPRFGTTRCVLALAGATLVGALASLPLYRRYWRGAYSSREAEDPRVLRAVPKRLQDALRSVERARS